MKILKSTLMASALILGTASMSFAQDKSYGSGTKAKEVATDKATDMAKDKAKDMVGDKAGAMVDPAMKAGKHMMKGDSAKDAMMKAGESEAKSMMKDKAKSYGSGTKAEDAMMKKEEKSYGSGSKGDAMMKDKAKSYGSGSKSDAMMKDKMMDKGTIKTSTPSYGSGAPAAAPAATLNCPAGTTAQANGTCMITGNYQPRS